MVSRIQQTVTLVTNLVFKGEVNDFYKTSWFVEFAELNGEGPRFMR